MNILHNIASMAGIRRILGVGIVTLDVINNVDHYPAEDEALRATKHRRARGGNCANTLCVLSSVLNERTSLVSTIAAGADTNFVLRELHAAHVDTSYCRVYPNCSLPTSYITLNEQNGSRTIVHFRDLPELNAAHDFISHVSLEDCDWIHFEGRNIEQVALMMAHVDAYNAKLVKRAPIKISLEVERAKLVNFEQLMVYPDIVFFSKEFAESRDCSSALELMELMRLKTEKRSILICAWGENGATALDENDNAVHSDSFPPPKVIDTLGAGDTFIAGTIYALRANKSLEVAIKFGCKLAGAKCGVEGFHIQGVSLDSQENVVSNE